MLEFEVNGQRLRIKGNLYVVAESIDYLKARFSFSADWDGVIKTAIFKTADRKSVYHVILDENGICTVPSEVIHAPMFRVSVFGGSRITANEVEVLCDVSGYAEGEFPGDPAPDIHEQILLEIAKKVSKVEGMDLSQNSYTNEEKEKLEKLPTGEALNEALNSISNRFEGKLNGMADSLSQGISGVGTALSTHIGAKILDHPDGSVTEVKIADGAVGTDKLADGAVTAEKIADGVLFSGKYDDLTGVPTEFPPSGHSHTVGDITDLAEWAKQPEKPTYTADEVGALAADGTAVRASADANGNNIPDTYATKVQLADLSAVVGDVTALLGYDDDDIVGLQVDYANSVFTRLAGAKNLTAGADFDKYTMFGGRRRCNVADDGTINAYYGDEGYTEDGSNGQVMVYQPVFYYMVVPLVYDKQETGIGYHLRKANYYASDMPKPGFKRHPAFYDENGNEVDYILLSAYEGSIYDTSESAYLMNDEQVADFAADKFCSIAGVKPASGLTQNLTRPNVEQLAKNRGVGWHSYNIKAASANQYLMVVEMAMLNMQTAIGQGIVSITDNSSYNCSSLTGSTSALGNATGQATETINEIGGTQTAYITSEKLAVTYRGMENPWGNLWKFVYGINIWGDGKMNGGQPFICSDFNFAENKKTDNYKGAGFTVTNANGYISAMGYSTACDWLFMASECLGNSSLPVGDYHYITQNLNGYRIARLGSGWHHGTNAGGFFWALNDGVGSRARAIGGRLVYVPTAKI